MNVYLVTNGYTGFGFVHVVVHADSENRARELARAAFYENALPKWGTGHPSYPASYWERLTVEKLFDSNAEGSTKVMD